ncbi:hypothetical protein Ahy_A03g011827 [Arachis hypogaea]|uniref:RNase H type-1 domain-containing protein n=1 Tax=Arachis hypogaea TaxID=3818 RepID=A0A445DRU2_ARAHY|nr:hypothetical protein Ahy_A03g011827 [Arachis hypogaea]
MQSRMCVLVHLESKESTYIPTIKNQPTKEGLIAEFQKATHKSSTENKSETVRRGEKRRITWRPLPRNRLKANVDAAFHKDTGTAALAVVVRDWQGKVITGTTATFKTISALTAEAQAYREALILIKIYKYPSA